MPKTFSLPEKPCTLGKKFSTTGEGEGSERTSIAKFSLEDVMLTAKELDKLGGPGTHERWYTKDPKSQEIIPAFDDVSEICFVHRYTDSTITLDLDGTTLTLPKSKIMNITTQRQNGGMTWSSCDIEFVQVEYADENGTRCQRKAKGLNAAVIAHEIDHLNGVLFIDGLEDAA